jgi:hypothetical protein
MGQSSSRHAAPSRVSFRRSIRTIRHNHTESFVHYDDDNTSELEVLSRRLRTISHRAEVQNNHTTPKHRTSSSCHAAPASNRTGHRAPQTPTSSSRQSHTTPDRSYEEARPADRRNSYVPGSPTSGPRSRGSFTGARHRRSRPRKECVVCTDSRSRSHFPSEPPTARCAHDADVCRRCLRAWITTSFLSKTWDDINCPTCAERLMIEEIRDFAPSDIYRQYKRFHTKAELEALPGWHWCIWKGCKSGQQIARGTSKFKCVRCKQAHCVEHNVSWHKGETCKQYDQRSVLPHASGIDWN